MGPSGGHLNLFRGLDDEHNVAMTPALEQERALYEAHETEWAAAHPGRFVVVKGDRLLGAYDSIEQALAAGAASFGPDSFLVRRLGERQEEILIPALTLGLLRANPQHPASGSGS
jgi:hypothetical protein